MRSLTNLPFVVRGAILALVVLIAAGVVLLGPAGFGLGTTAAAGFTVASTAHIQYAVSRNKGIFNYDVLAARAPKAGHEPVIDDLKVRTWDQDPTPFTDSLGAQHHPSRGIATADVNSAEQSALLG